MANEFSSEDHLEKHPASVSDSDVPKDASHSPSLDRDPFEELASEFAERHRRGEFPSIEAYAQANPELADEIRELFPTIAAMEQLKERKAPAPKPTLGGLPLEELGDFRILGEIGRGGMGVVYEAEQVSLGRHVAVKVLPKQALLDERHLRRFEREAQTAAKLHHTNIVPVFGVGQQDGYHYIVMQFIPGVGLDEVLVALRSMVLTDADQLPTDNSSRASHASHNAKALLKGRFGRPVTTSFTSSFQRADSSSARKMSIDVPTVAIDSTQVTTTSASSSEHDSQPLDADYGPQLASVGPEFYRSIARIGHQVANALAYAHEQGTLHRDIKPGNLLLDSTGTVWVADFGLAKIVEQDNVSRTGDIVGTLSYMPPESFSVETDARGDIYALGLTLFEMLAMRPAFYGRDRGKLVKQITEGELPRLGKLNPWIPRDLETIVLKAISHEPDDRYATAQDFAEDLQHYLEDLPIKARRMSVAEQVSRWCRRNKLVASLAASILTLLVVTSVTFGYLKLEADQAAQTASEERDKAEKAAQVATEAEEETKTAYVQVKQEKENAKNTANEAIAALLSIFDGLAPDRLPLSADDSLQTAEPAEDLTAEADLDASEDTAATVAPPPVTEETAATLKILLATFEKLAKRAGDDSEFALTFADLTLRVGKLHKMLGKDQEALESFEDAIQQYEALVGDTPQAIVGLAMSYNEKGDVIARTQSFLAAHRTYRKALALLQDKEREPLLANSPRAQYEKARTLFLMSVQREGRGFRPPRGGGPPPGSQRGGGPRGERRPPDPGRRGEGPGGRGGFEGFFGGHANLQKAIDILKGLKETESDPEYRYLLARCHTGLSIVARGPGDRKEQEVNIAEAMSILSRLVGENPDVADYKFEFAVAQLLSLEIVRRRGDAELEIAKSVAELLDDIATNNPSISNYSIIRAVALVRQAEIYDQHADRLSRQDDPDEKRFRTETLQAAEKAASVLQQVKGRFPEQMDDVSGRFPGLAGFDFFRARVTAKAGDNESAAKLYRQILERLAADGDARGNQRRTHEARVCLAKCLELSGQNDQAESLAQISRDELKRFLDEEVEQVELRRFDRNRRFHEAMILYADAEYILSGIDKTKKSLQSIRDQRISAIAKARDGQASKTDIAELDLQVARCLRNLGQPEVANKLLDQIQLEMQEILQSDLNPKELTGNPALLFAKMAESWNSRRILTEVLQEKRDEDELDRLFQSRREDFEKRRALIDQLRREMPERFGAGGPGRGRPRGGPGNGRPRSETPSDPAPQ